MQNAPSTGFTRRKRQLLLSILRLGVAAGLIGWLLHSIPISRVASAIESASFSYLSLAAATVTISMYLEALRTRIIAQSQRIEVSTAQMLAIDLGASFYALFLPWGTLSRGAIRIFRISQFGATVSTATVVILRDRLESTAVMALIGVGFLAYAIPMKSGSAAILMVGTVIATFIVYLILFTPIRIPVVGAWTWFPAIKRLELLRQPMSRARTMSLQIQLVLLAYSLVMHLLIVSTFYFLAKSLALDIALTTMGWVRSAVTLVTMLPVTIGGIGLRETAMLFFLTPYGVEEAQAIALAFLIFVFVLLIPGLVGGLLEGWRAFRNRSVPTHNHVEE